MERMCIHGDETCGRMLKSFSASLIVCHERFPNFILFYLFIYLFYYSYVHTMLGSFLPPAPTPSINLEGNTHAQEINVSQLPV
jgi:hypothetical protein